MTTAETIDFHFVNHAVVDVDCPPERVWAAILDLRTGAPFAARGALVEPFTDEALAPLGGYRVSLRDASGTLADERECIITECDEAEFRLALYASWLGPAEKGMKVRSSYQAIATPAGSRYEIHCHVTQPVPRLDTGGPSLLERYDSIRAESGAGLQSALDAWKTAIESGNSAA